MRKRRKVFDIYESELRKVNHPVYRIFNADTTGIITVQHRTFKTVIMRGKKEVASNIGSVVTCRNAAGTYVPPLTLRLLMSYIYGAPTLDVSRSLTTTQHSR